MGEDEKEEDEESMRGTARQRDATNRICWNGEKCGKLGRPCIAFFYLCYFRLNKR
jgi:hypothetical protein